MITDKVNVSHHNEIGKHVLLCYKSPHWQACLYFINHDWTISTLHAEAKLGCYQQGLPNQQQTSHIEKFCMKLRPSGVATSCWHQVLDKRLSSALHECYDTFSLVNRLFFSHRETNNKQPRLPMPFVGRELHLTAFALLARVV